MAKAKRKKPADVPARQIAKSVGPGKAPEVLPSSPDQLQKELAELDQDLIRLLNRRATALVTLAQARRQAGQAPFVFAEEEERIARAVAANPGPLPNEAIRAALREAVGGCRSLVRGIRVAFLGPLYTYSHLAAIAHFGQSVELAPVGSIAAVFEEVNRGQSDFGLVPIENSTDGRIADTLDMFTRLPLKICGEVELEIQHFLLGKCARNDVHEVYSKQQPLSQCRNWLARHLPGARAIEVTSTSTAAQLALEKPGAAAIASLQAGMHYGLDVIAERIEDNPNNTTRFAVIGDYVSGPTGNDRTAVLFQTEHRFGALAEVLNIFKRNRLNLTWIESFPVPDCARTYLFFVEIEGHQSEKAMQKCLQSLEASTLRLEILGSFPAASRDG